MIIRFFRLQIRKQIDTHCNRIFEIGVFKVFGFDRNRVTHLTQNIHHRLFDTRFAVLISIPKFLFLMNCAFPLFRRFIGFDKLSYSICQHKALAHPHFRISIRSFSFPVILQHNETGNDPLCFTNALGNKPDSFVFRLTS